MTGEFTTTITWDIPPGTYRVVHHGDAKNGLTAAVSPFAGVSRPFAVA
ncbi:neutral/alkaline non-lysosomal ceramidase C-terminal domain-containing protein [Streptomyces parvulus]